ncbi:MAG: ATP-binding protein [Salinivirgaceae bacterium]|nr:ATP-binding protein [Salinivirgaceae bacterium]
MFNRFRQVELSDTPNYGGTGIGLAIVKEYATILSGSISMSSEYGKGSSFILQIPLKIDAENKNSTQSMLDISIN